MASQAAGRAMLGGRSVGCHKSVAAKNRLLPATSRGGRVKWAKVMARLRFGVQRDTKYRFCRRISAPFWHFGPGVYNLETQNSPWRQGDTWAHHSRRRIQKTRHSRGRKVDEPGREPWVRK